MKKKIGFIDLFIDEWHANNYPKWIRESKYADDFELHMAWEQTTKPGLRPLEKWCADFNVTPASSQEQLIEECDGIIVLAPSNPEVHEELGRLALQSGKPVYMDKPFAPDRATAERIFACADKHNTPLFSSSALRFSNELAELKSGMFKDEKIQLVGTTGGGSSYWEYCIHQIEMIVTLMGVGATRLMQTTGGANKHVVIEYADGRIAHVNYAPCFPETLMVAGDKSSTIVHQCSNFFPTLLDTILKFFNDRIVPIPQAETLEVAGIVGQSVAAQSCPNVWFDL